MTSLSLPFVNHSLLGNVRAVEAANQTHNAPKRNFVISEKKQQYKWVAMSKDEPTNMCAQRRLRSTCAESEQNPHWTLLWKLEAKFSLRKQAYIILTPLNPTFI